MPSCVGAVESGVADGLLVRRHAAVHGLRDDAGEQPEAAQQHEGTRVGGGRPFRRDQRALGREHHVEDLADAFVDVDLGRALRRVGEVAQDRRDPFDQERAAGIVGRPVDRAGGLRIGAGEVEGDALAPLDHLERELVQLGVGDAVVLDVVLPAIFAVGDLRQQFVAERCRGTCRGSPGSRLPRFRAPNRSNSSAMRRAPITQACTSLSRSAASMSGTRVLRLMMVKTASLRTPAL